jgi:alcohol dehydrogenase (NADP+)
VRAPADAKKWSDFSLVKYPSKKWEETDVEIAITHCGCVRASRF